MNELFFGNEKFLHNPSFQKDRQKFLNQHTPSFCILTCSDARVSPEIIFSQSLGNLFVIRNAGNVVDEVTLASIEFAVQILKVPNLIVLGHQNCAAVQGALEVTLQQAKVKLTSLNYIFEKIQPSLKNVVQSPEMNQEKWNQAVQDNAIYQLNVLLKKSTVIREAYRENRLALHSLYYEMDTGKVLQLK